MIELIIEYKDGGGKSLKWCSLCHFFFLIRTAPVDFIIVGLSPEIFGETDTSAWVQRNGYCCQLRPVIQGLSQYVWWVQRKFGQIKFNICTCNTKRTFAAGKICLELKIWRAKRSVPVESTTGKFMKIQYTCSRYFLWLKIFAVQTLKGIKFCLSNFCNYITVDHNKNKILRSQYQWYPCSDVNIQNKRSQQLTGSSHGICSKMNFTNGQCLFNNFLWSMHLSCVGLHSLFEYRKISNNHDLI